MVDLTVSLEQQTSAKRHMKKLGAILFLFILASCGGTDSPQSLDRKPVLAAAIKQADSPHILMLGDYNDVLQQLYVGYFGRPADPAGLAYYEAQLLAAGAPTTMSALLQAYSTNPAVKAILDGFSGSAESAALYPTNNNNAFISAVYQNLFNRVADPAGLAYWSGLLASNALNRASVAASIMAGSLTSDSVIISNKTLVASNFTQSLNTDAKASSYSGLPVNVLARTMLSTVSDKTDAIAFQSSINTTIDSITRLNPKSDPPLSNTTYVSVTVAGLNTHGQSGTLRLASGTDIVDVTKNGNYTFATPVGGAARLQKILVQPSGQACALTATRQSQVDPYTQTLVSSSTADYYCFESPCGNLVSLGKAPAPKMISATWGPLNLDGKTKDVTVSFQPDIWGTSYHIWYGTSPSPVATSPVTGNAEGAYEIALAGSSTEIIPSQNPELPLYVAISSLYNSPSNLESCQSDASSAMLASSAPLSMSPTTGVVGSIVIISGEKFDKNITNDLVIFNGIPANIVAATDTSLTVTVPNGATTGPVILVIDGTLLQSALNFTVIGSDPVISGSIGFKGTFSGYTSHWDDGPRSVNVTGSFTGVGIATGQAGRSGDTIGYEFLSGLSLTSNSPDLPSGAMPVDKERGSFLSAPVLGYQGEISLSINEPLVRSGLLPGGSVDCRIRVTNFKTGVQYTGSVDISTYNFLSDTFSTSYVGSPPTYCTITFSN